ncbi:hypothetical protein AAH105_05515 [Parabacteroides distasonis]|uniref:hypothetical protein n=1 Tax=Parabacteroides distasonis TaxID=823 RepID=UPI0015FC9352|nr:hypothetical protein [Parabacteroides distasonis]
MFTPSMTEEEIEQAAYKDYLEIRTRVQIAFERFAQSMRISGKHKRAIHSLSESHTLCTQARNTWNVNFRYTGYTPDGKINIVCYLYIPLRRENGVDYLFMNDPKCFKVERVSSHFLQRYKERYLDPAGIDLKGVHPAIYFMQNNEDRRQAYYLPKNWTDEELAEKCFLVSGQGLSLIKLCGKTLTYITFLDQENLSRYKAQVCEEEEYLHLMGKAKDSDILGLQAISKKLCADIEHTRRVMNRLVLRAGRTPEQREELSRMLDNGLKVILEQTTIFDEAWKETVKKYEAKSLLDFGIEKIADQLRAPSEGNDLYSL